MLELTKRQGERIDIAVAGEIDATAMDRVLDELMLHMASAEHALLLFDIEDFHWPSLDAVRVKFARIRGLFGLRKKIERVAIVTDERWMHRASKVESALLPGVEVKAFARAEMAPAQAWLAAGDASAGR